MSTKGGCDYYMSSYFFILQVEVALILYIKRKYIKIIRGRSECSMFHPLSETLTAVFSIVIETDIQKCFPLITLSTNIYITL